MCARVGVNGMPLVVGSVCRRLLVILQAEMRHPVEPQSPISECLYLSGLVFMDVDARQYMILECAHYGTTSINKQQHNAPAMSVGSL